MPDLLRKQRLSSWGALSLTLGSIGAGFGVAACCALPVLLGSVGFGTAWLFGIAKLAAPHRSLLLDIGAASLAGGAIALWYQSRVVCATDGWCSRPAVRVLTAIGLAVSLVLLVLGHRYA
jgi:mercuric ion transport protein